MNKNTVNSILKKVKSDYNTIADQFSQTRYRDWAEFFDFEKYVKTGDSVLDLGCGNGRLLHFLNKYRIKYIGVDPSENLISIAKEIADKRITSSISSYSFMKGSAQELPFPDNTFDSVFAIASLYHIPSSELRLKAVQEISRVLKPDGIFIMTYWNMWNRSRRTLIIKNIFKKIIGVSRLDFFDSEKSWKNPAGNIIVNRYCHAFTLREIEKIAKKSNIKEIEKYYMKKGRRSNSIEGFNGVYIGKKY